MELNAFFFQMGPDDAGKRAVENSGQHLVFYLYQVSLDPPEVAKRLGHLAANCPGAYDYSPVHLPARNSVLHGDCGVKV